MKRLLLLTLLVPSGSFAQEVHRLDGTIQVPGAEPRSYFVQFTITDTEVSGFSITNYQEGNRLRASLTGKVSSATGLYIEETGLLDEPENPLATFCYFRAQLKLKEVDGRQQWSGTFEGRQIDGQSCQGGFMTIVDGAPPLPEFGKTNVGAKALPAVTLPDPLPATITTAPQARQVTNPNPVPNNNGYMRTYNWISDSLAFELWDNWTIDGDVVSLTINDRPILDHIKLSETKLHLSLPLLAGKNTMMLYLHNEGSDPSNTPALILLDGKTQYQLGISGRFGEKVCICFNRSE